MGVIVRQARVEKRRQQSQRGIKIKHQPDGAEFWPAVRCEQLGQRCGQRSDGGGQCADQAVAREHVGAVAVGGLLGQQRVLERHQHAEIAAGRVDASDESDQQNRHEALGPGNINPVRTIKPAPARNRFRNSKRGAMKPTIKVSAAVPSSEALATIPISSGLKPIAVR